MDAFCLAHSARPDWPAACEECSTQLAEQQTNAPHAPDSDRLGFIYVTDAFGPNLAAIVAKLQETTGVTHWVGSVGLGICVGSQEYFGVPAMATLVGSWPRAAFQVFDTVKSDWTGFDAQLESWDSTATPTFAVVHGDPGNGQLPQLIDTLSEKLGGGFLVGGLTSAETAMLQVADGLTSGGLSGVLFSSDVPVVTRLTQGCSPIGERHEVTRADRNIIIELDGRPALEVFKEDIGEILARDLRRAAGYIFAGLPIKGSDTGDYLVRNLVGVDPRTEIVAIGEWVEAGDKVMFCRRDQRAAAQDMERMLSDIKAASSAPRGGVYFSCLARGPNLFGPNSEEVRMIQSQLGDVPLVGFFANGEISHNRLYAYTGVLTLFG